MIGFDGNHWNRAIDLALPSVPESNNPGLLENQFFGDNPPHRLRDVLLDYLRQYPRAYADVVQQRPQGPLAVSYVRGTTKNPVEDRFDYIFVSDGIGVASCSYDYAATTAAPADDDQV